MQRKARLFVVAACIVLVSTYFAWAAAPQPAELTGEQWVQSSSAEKRSFLYGAASIVAIEKIGAQRTGNPASFFVESWENAFKDATIPQIQQKLDAWYAEHPDQKNRHVFEVIWYELIRPTQGK